MRELQSKLPRLPDMVAGLQNMVGGLQDPRGEIPPPPKPSLLSPAMREKETAGLEFEDVVDYEPGRSGVRDRLGESDMDGNAAGEIARHFEEFREKMREINRLQEQHAKLTASATAERRRVTATVNAHGVLVDVKFSSDIDDLTYSEVAEAITEASRAAVAEVGRKGTALFAPLRTERGDAPNVGDIARTIAELRSQL